MGKESKMPAVHKDYLNKNRWYKTPSFLAALVLVTATLALLIHWFLFCVIIGAFLVAAFWELACGGRTEDDVEPWER